MAMNYHPSLLLLSLSSSLSLLLLLGVSAAISSQTDGGTWVQIANPADPYVVELAKFAVDQHNKEAETKLVFLNLLMGETQVVAGINYRLTITVNEDGSVKDYEAVVYVRPWAHSKKLVSFKPL